MSAQCILYGDTTLDALTAAPETGNELGKLPRGLAHTDVNALAYLASRLVGKWRCEIRRDKRGDLEAVIARDGEWRSSNGFVVQRTGSIVSIIATSWPFSPALLAQYDCITKLTGYLGNAIGLRK